MARKTAHLSIGQTITFGESPCAIPVNGAWDDRETARLVRDARTDDGRTIPAGTEYHPIRRNHRMVGAELAWLPTA